MATPTPQNPAATPASTTAPALAWAYPFPGANHKEITDPQTFHHALSSMDDGFFPLGVNGFPHGGVHFGNGSATQLNQSGGVRCIADGEIVAHKLDRAYPHLQFADGKWAAYSTGFVLVRHRLSLPPAPKSTGTQPADETHDIYSLYMHMADWYVYLADGKLDRPYWWDVEAYRIRNKDRQSPPPDGGPDGAVGAFVWTEPNAGKKKGQYTAGKHTGFLPEGSEVIMGEKRGKWGHIQAITAGGMISPVSGGIFGSDDINAPWETPGYGAPEGTAVTPKGDWGWLYLPDQQPVKEPKQLGEVVIPATPIPVKAGTLLGQIGEYQDYERATPLPPTSRRKQLHLEVFADDGFSGFLSKSRDRAAQLPADQRTRLVIDAGAKLVQSVAPPDRKLSQFHPLVTPDSPESGMWVKVQPRYLDSHSALLCRDGPPAWIEREKLTSAPDNTPAWTQFPLRLQGVADPANGFPIVYSRGQLDALKAHSKATDDQNVNWWRVTLDTADGKSVTGWVCEKNHPATKWESPWAWPGFETIDATGINLADAFKRNLVITGAATWKEKMEFEPAVVAVNNSALLLKLEQTVAKQTESGKSSGKNSSKVTARAMQAAMRVPSLAQALSHVILRYESEWGGDLSRWNAITPLMRNAKNNWLRELERVKKLQWWNDVKGKVPGFPASATVMHIHPVALVNNFISQGLSCPHCGANLTITPEILKRIFSSISQEDAVGFSLELNFSFNRHKINTCRRISHFFGQCEVESGGFTAFREDLHYKDGERLWAIYPTALKSGLHRLHPDWTVSQMEEYTKTRLVNNDRELGMVLFGDNSYPNRDYRGRGLLHLTWLASYSQYKDSTGIDIASDPTKVESDRRTATDSSAWFWSSRSINVAADANNPKNVTKIINPALKDFARRKDAARRAFELINKGRQPCKRDWDTTSTVANGW